jgi:hypothetical protein
MHSSYMFILVDIPVAQHHGWFGLPIPVWPGRFVAAYLVPAIPATGRLGEALQEQYHTILISSVRY